MKRIIPVRIAFSKVFRLGLFSGLVLLTGSCLSVGPKITETDIALCQTQCKRHLGLAGLQSKVELSLFHFDERTVELWCLCKDRQVKAISFENEYFEDLHD